MCSSACRYLLLEESTVDAAEFDARASGGARVVSETVRQLSFECFRFLRVFGTPLHLIMFKMHMRRLPTRAPRCMTLIARSAWESGEPARAREAHSTAARTTTVSLGWCGTDGRSVSRQLAALPRRVHGRFVADATVWRCVSQLRHCLLSYHLRVSV
jgi:hypothetical protein